jgi:hypothetical protein
MNCVSASGRSSIGFTLAVTSPTVKSIVRFRHIVINLKEREREREREIRGL